MLFGYTLLALFSLFQNKGFVRLGHRSVGNIFVCGNTELNTFTSMCLNHLALSSLFTCALLMFTCTRMVKVWSDGLWADWVILEVLKRPVLFLKWGSWWNRKDTSTIHIIHDINCGRLQRQPLTKYLGSYGFMVVLKALSGEHQFVFMVLMSRIDSTEVGHLVEQLINGTGNVCLFPTW